jgi:hypothetical protein
MFSVWSPFRLCIGFLLLSTIAAAQTETQPKQSQAPAAEQARQAREKVITAQQQAASGPAVIRLGPAGPLDEAFQDFDLPFRVSTWFCGVEAPERQEDPTLRTVRTRAKRREDERECAEKIDAAIAKGAEVTFLYEVPAGAPSPTTPATLMIRVIGGSTIEVPQGPVGATMPLATLRQLAAGDRVDLLILSKGQETRPIAAIGLTFATVPQLPSAESRETVSGPQVTVRLDRTGVASTAFLNPRRPVYLGPPPGNEPERTWQDRAVLLFTNRVADRQFVVTFSGIPAIARLSFLAAGVRLTNCQDGECDALIIVPPGSRGERKLPVRLLREAYVGEKKLVPVTSFSVELFHDEVQLANPQGYFSLVPFELVEPKDDGSKWHASVTADAASSPDLSDLQATPEDDPVISDTAPRGGANDALLAGTARIGLKQSLGSIVSGEFDLRLKSGPFGTPPSVDATKYRLNVFGANGATYSGGLYTIAEPSEAVALSETGENVGLHIGFIDANYILRRYVPALRRDVLDFEDRQADRNHSAVLLQVRNAGPLTWKFAQLDLYALYGRKSATRCIQLTEGACPSQPGESDNAVPVDPSGKPLTFALKQRYWTYGAELTFGFKEGWGGSAALYHSQLRVKDAPEQATLQTTDSGDGTVGLFTIGWTKFQKTVVVDDRPSLFTVRAQLGIGTGDDPTKDGNQGYLGETAGFAPDQLFLSVLAPAIQTARGQVGAGLSNKTYIGFLVSTPQWSPLQYLADVMNVPSTDVAGKSTTIKFHQYRFNEEVNGRRSAGSELNIEFAFESPGAVTYSIGGGAFWPGAALTEPGDARLSAAFAGLEPLIRRMQWNATARLTVKM